MSSVRVPGARPLSTTDRDAVAATPSRSGRMARRWAVVLLASALLAAACSGSTDSAETAPTSTVAPRPVQPRRAPGFDTEIIRLGVIGDLTGANGRSGREILTGVEAFWSRVDAMGGIGERFPVELIVRDEGGSPALAAQVYSGISDEVALLALVMGSATVDAVRGPAVDDGLLIAPSTRQFAWLGAENLLPVGTSYEVEVIDGLGWYMDNRRSDAVFCGVTDPSSYGRASRAGLGLVEAALDGSGVDFGYGLVVELEPDFDATAVVEQITTAGCEVVWLGAGDLSTRRLMAELAAGDVDITGFVGSGVRVPVPEDSRAWARDHLLVAADLPSWSDRTAGMENLRAELEKVAPDAEPTSMVALGWASQYPVLAVLEAAVADGDLGRDHLAELSTSLGTYDTGDMVQPVVMESGLRPWPRPASIFSVDPAGGDVTGLTRLGTFEAPFVDVVESLR